MTNASFELSLVLISSFSDKLSALLSHIKRIIYFSLTLNFLGFKKFRIIIYSLIYVGQLHHGKLFIKIEKILDGT